MNGLMQCYVAFLLVPPPEVSQTFRVHFRRCATEKPDYRHRMLLRVRRERPGRNTESQDELPPPCMTGKEHCGGRR